MPFFNSQFGLKTDDVVGFTEQQRLATEMQVTFSIVDEATWLYRNFKYPRHKNFYGYAQLMAGAYVVRSIPLEFINQELLFWQQDTTDLLQSIACEFKDLFASLPTPKVRIATLFQVRQRYTSIRFRLGAGVKANVALSWKLPDSLCAELVNPPPDKQGQSPLPNNKDGDPANRPSGQGGDAGDPSNNDGKDDPNDALPDHPVPGKKRTASGQWYNVYVARDSGCVENPAVKRYGIPGAVDPSIVPVQLENEPGCAPGTKSGNVLYGGAVMYRADSFVTSTFEFVPD